MQMTPDGKYLLLGVQEVMNAPAYYVRYLCTRCGVYTSVLGNEFHEKWHERLEGYFGANDKRDEERVPGAHELRVEAGPGTDDGGAEALAVVAIQGEPGAEEVVLWGGTYGG